MTKTQSRWRLEGKVLAGAVTLSVPALALTLFGGNVLGLLSGPAAAAEFRVYEPAPVAQTAAVKADAAAQGDDSIEVELTTWEQTKLNISGNK